MKRLFVFLVFAICLYAQPTTSHITGNISYETGVATGGVTVMALAVDGHDYYETTTDASGNYDLLVDLGTYEVTCYEASYSSIPEAHTVHVASGAIVIDIDFVLTEGSFTYDAWVSGIVTMLSPFGSLPVSGAYIYILGDDIYEGYTDSDGFYLINVNSGTFDMISCESYIGSPTPAGYTSVTVASGETATGYDFVLGGGTPADSIIVEVGAFSATGEPQAGVNVVIRTDRGEVVGSELTDDTGIAVFNYLPVGDYIATVPSHETSPPSIAFHAASDTSPHYLEFIFAETIIPEYNVVLKSIDTTGVAHPELEVNWRYMGTVPWTTISTDLSGFYTFDLDSAVAMEFRPIAIEGYSINPAMTSIALTAAVPQDTIVFTVTPESYIKENLVPNQIDLRAYPNPFNSCVKIVRSSNAPVQIYSLQGKLIETVYGQSWTPKCESGIFVAVSGNDKVNLLYTK